MSPELSILIGSKGSQRKRKAEAGQSLKAQALELQSAKSQSCFSHFLAVRLGVGNMSHTVIERVK